MSEHELERRCKETGLSPRGSKRDLVKRLGPPNVLLSIGFCHRRRILMPIRVVWLQLRLRHLWYLALLALIARPRRSRSRSRSRSSSVDYRRPCPLPV